MYYVDAQQYLVYSLNVANIHLRSGTTLQVPKLPLITKILYTPIASKPTTSKPQVVDPTNITSSPQTQIVIKPPFLEKIIQSKSTQTKDQFFNIIYQLKNMHV